MPDDKLPSMDDFTDPSELPSVEDFITEEEVKEELPSVEDFIENPDESDEIELENGSLLDFLNMTFENIGRGN